MENMTKRVAREWQKCGAYINAPHADRERARETSFHISSNHKSNAHAAVLSPNRVTGAHVKIELDIFVGQEVTSMGFGVLEMVI